MSEVKQIAALTLITFIIAGLGLTLIKYSPYFMEGDVIVDSYKAVFYADGTLIENYVYEVKSSNKYRMLYRVWDAALSIKQLNEPSIEFLNASTSEKAIVYLKDFQGIVWVNDSLNNDLINEIESLAYLNEVGVFNPEGFKSGRYNVTYAFKIYPPIEYDGKLCHLNLKLADEHLTYRTVEVTLKNASYILKVFPHPPSLKIIKYENEFRLYGSSSKDEIIEVELLLKKDVLSVINGFLKEVKDVNKLTVEANRYDLIQYYLGLTLLRLSQTAALAFPFLFLLVYIAYGREKRFIIPKYLSVTPNNKLKPWIVNLVFKSDPLNFDENGFYATLLDLHKKGKIKINLKNRKGLIIQLINEEGLDTYEVRVIKFLKDLSSNNIVDTDEVKKLVKTLSSSRKFEWKLLELKDELLYLTKKAEASIAENYMVNGRRKLIPFILASTFLLLISILLVFASNYLISLTALASSFIPLTQSLIALAFPSTLFGKWKSLFYKEKLEWDSFKRFLSDLVLIKKYSPKDLSIWGEWLIYGTALGVGDNIAKAMEEFKISLEDVKIVRSIPVVIQPIATAIPFSKSQSHSGFSGGGFGAGGGFGGGGAGAR
ncbi:MAG: DUF2207 domain-containing protein [Candidatus Bathyarchaeia archaeon]